MTTLRRLAAAAPALVLLLPCVLPAQTLAGRLTERGTDAAIAGGIVRVVDGSARVVGVDTTDAAGAFSIVLAAPGVYSFTAAAAGYETSEFDAVAVGAEGMRVRLVVGRAAVVLDTVVARPAEPEPFNRYGGFYQRVRQRGAGATYFVREDIERSRPVHLADILRRVPALEVQVGGESGWGGSRVLRVRLRHAMSFRRCLTIFYLDGMRVEPESVQELGPEEIEGVEVYTHGAVPAQFNSVGGSACGVVAVWRRLPPNV